MITVQSIIKTENSVSGSEIENRMRIIVLLNNKFGVINKTGKIIIECIYDEIIQRNGYIEVRIKTKNWKRDPQGDDIKKLQNDFVNFRKGLFDITGKKIIECDFNYIGDFEDGLADVLKGYIDKAGNKYWED